MAKLKNHTTHPPPEGRVRRSQAISTYGPGSMVDLIDHAVVVGGLQHWQYPTWGESSSIKEPRLRDLLVHKLKKIDPNSALGFEDPFRFPPTGDDHRFDRGNGIRVFEFPLWFVCQECRALVGRKALSTSPKKKRYEHACDGNRKGLATPVRFVMACPNGHLQDVDWNWFVHRGSSCTTPTLRLSEGKTRDFSEIKVSCECRDAARMLADLYNNELRPDCTGRQPWLGTGVSSGCDQKLSLIIRTASNGYFPQVVSALSIPEVQNQVRDAVTSVIGKLEIVKDAKTLELVKGYSDVAKALGNFSSEDVLEALNAIRTGIAAEREPLRSAEYHRLLQEPEEKPGDLPPVKQDFFARAYVPDEPLPAGIKRLVRVHRLREVRVQVGFTRLEAPTADLQGEYDLGVKTAPLTKGATWLPAAEILGEGLFLELDPEAVVKWENRKAVKARAECLAEGYGKWAAALGEEAPPFPGVRYYMLHSLAHLLMTALAMECGYSTSSLGERIYCSLPGAKERLAGILIKTGTPGAEGTLGGLVEEGRRLSKHLRRAWDLGTLCSHDPVCAGHEPQDLEERPLDGAACHGCLYIAESACERWNRYLNRALVVPTIGCDPNVAFLAERP